MLISYDETAKFLLENDNYTIFAHANPDGDTIGSSFGLCFALRKLGKNANVLCSDEFAEKFSFIYDKYSPQQFVTEKYISADVADAKLLGKKYSEDFADKIDLCIDHHISNTKYAKTTLLQADFPAAAQVIFELINTTGMVEFDELIASCLYTGIVTDTGCFRYSSVIPKTHLAAAKLMEYGINYAEICRDMMEKKNFKRLEIERVIHSTMEFHLENKVSIGAILLCDTDRIGIEKKELDGMAYLTTELDTIEIGVLIREQEQQKFKVSLRSTGEINVCEICAKFGGGGHAKAAGCTILGSLDEVKSSVLAVLEKTLGENL